MFQVGDQITYCNSRKQTFPGRVLAVKKRIKISYEHSTGPKTSWVNPEHVALKESSRCAHNAECGWCGDTGRCIYETP